MKMLIMMVCITNMVISFYIYTTAVVWNIAISVFIYTSQPTSQSNGSNHQFLKKIITVFKYRVRQITFSFLKCYKKTTEYFLKFLFLFESTILPVNNGK